MWNGSCLLICCVVSTWLFELAQSDTNSVEHSTSHGNISNDGAAINQVYDCASHLNAGFNQSGVYKAKFANQQHEINVLCDMETDGGGWTIIQKRGEFGNSPDYFNKTWEEYKNGFGELDKEFWIGNAHLNVLTNQGGYQLRIDMWNLTGNHTFAQYESFRIGNETENFRLHIGNFSGNAGDCMSTLNGWPFSTFDRDNDSYDSSCAQEGGGAWWYKDCSPSNLNGPHMGDPDGQIPQSIYWMSTNGMPNLLRQTAMMVRRVSR